MYRPRSWSSISSFRIGRLPGMCGLSGIVLGVTIVGRRWPGMRTCRSPFVGIDEQAAERLGIEVGRFLGHEVAVGGHGNDIADRCGFEEERGPHFGFVAADPADRLGRRLRV